MKTNVTLFGLLALLLLVAGCAEEIEAPTDPWVASYGAIEYVDDAFASAINPGDANGAQYQVYLPDGYSDSGSPFPVVYMLHGYGGDETMFPTIFGIDEVMNQLVGESDAPPMVLVFLNGDNEIGGSFYTNSAFPLVGTSADHVFNVIAEVEANYNVSTAPEGKGICGLSMGGYGSLSLAMDNPGVFSHVGVLSGPVSHWGTRTIDPTDMTYKGIEELLPTVLAQAGAYGFTPTATWDPANPDPAVQAQYQAAFAQALADGPPMSMMFALAAAYSPGDPANPGPTYVQFDPALPGVELPITYTGEIYTDVWNLWLARDILYRFLTDPAQAGAFATFDLYMAVGLSDDLGLHGAHQTLEGVLASQGLGPEVSRYFGTPADPSDPMAGFLIPDAFGGIPAGHVQITQPELKMMLEWFGESLQ